MISWRPLLLPFSWIFELLVGLKNTLYRIKVFPSKKFYGPFIGIGNLRIGGTGKTPFTEYLIRFLQTKYPITTLSRGYGRKTKGFLWVESPNAVLYGDEPSQFKKKFPKIQVAVSESRILGMEKILPEKRVVLLDDVFQHRKIELGMYWVLMEFEDLTKPVRVLPAGNYRESIRAIQRAQYILITKCPYSISPMDRIKIRFKLKLRQDQGLFFSEIQYQKPIRLGKEIDNKLPSWNDLDFILVFSGIGNPEPLKNYIKSQVSQFEFMDFPDHYIYSLEDIQNIKDRFNQSKAKTKIILTTEKDSLRLGDSIYEDFIHEYPLYFLPIEFQIQEEEKEFQEIILNYVKSTI